MGKRRNRADQKADPRRVFSFRFNLDDEQQQLARKMLEQWEDDAIDEDGSAKLADIITAMILEYGGQDNGVKPNIRRERNLFRAIKRGFNEVVGLLQSINDRLDNLTIYQPGDVVPVAASADDDIGDVDTGLLASLFGDITDTNGNNR